MPRVHQRFAGLGTFRVFAFPESEILLSLVRFVMRFRYRAVVGACIFLFALPLLAQDSARQAPVRASRAEQLTHSQVFFERNDGQTDKSVTFLNYGLGYSLFLTQDATMVFQVPAAATEHAAATSAKTVRLSILGADRQAEIAGVDEQPGKSNYFSGADPQLWHTSIPHFARVQYRHVYPGIDLVFYAKDGQLEYDFVVAPHANARLIRMKVEGARLSLTSDGEVLIGSDPKGPVKLKKPLVFTQGDQGQKVPAHYRAQGNELSIALGEYDHSQPLVIDPALIFSSFLTSNCSHQYPYTGCSDVVADVAVNSTGIYLTGSTFAPSFPAIQSGPPLTPGARRTFVVKLDPTGSQIAYTNFLDGSGQLYPVESVGVDALGSAYVTGIATFGNETTIPFPTTVGAFSRPPAGACMSTICQVPFATKLSPDGSTLMYSTLLQVAPAYGGLVPKRLALDSTGAVYVAGSAKAGGVLPVTVGAYQTTPPTLPSPFVMKVNPAGSGLDYSTYLGGSQPSADPAGIAVDGSHSAYIAADGFVRKLSLDGSSLVYSASFNGGIQDIAVDSAGEAVIVGSGPNPPTTPNAFCTDGPTVPASTNAFVAKFNPSGSALVYSTTLCGTDAEARSVAVDSSGAAYVVGFNGDPASIPLLLLLPIQGYPPGSGVVAKLDTGGAREWATLLGIGDTIGPNRIALDPAHNVYVLGVGGFQSPNALGRQFASGATLVKIAPSLGAPVPVFVPEAVSFGSTAVGSSAAPINVVLGNFGDAAMSPAVISVAGEFTETDNCSSSVPGGQKCDVNVTFTPTAGGTRTGILTAQTGGSTLTVSLSGNGASAMVNLAPTSLTFPPEVVGTSSAAQQIVITNGGTFPLTITSMATTGDFVETNTCGAAVAPAGTCTVQVTFTPTAPGARTGVLTVKDNAPDSPQTVGLTGSPQTLGLSVPSGGSSSTVTAGSIASYTLGIGAGGIAGNASLTCTGAPTGATCAVPATMAVNASSSTAFTVTVSTTSRTLSALHRIESFSRSWVWATLFLGLLIWPRARAGTRRSFAIVLLVALALCACGGGASSTGGGNPQPQPNPNGTPAGTYTLTVTATSGSMSQSVPLTLKVQ
jgi:Abnormal spindle-like microcephaly-assoc'd, ASPM-SPD-2-Hydin